MRAIKRTKTRDKREQAHREALRAQQSVDKSGAPRSAAGRIPGAFAADSLTKAQQKVICYAEINSINAACFAAADTCTTIPKSSAESAFDK